MNNELISIFDEPSRQPLPNEPKLKDHGAAVIKGALGSIPVLGGVLVEELGLVLASPLARRRDDWFADLARRLHDIEGRVDGFHFEDLANNEQFVSATLQATQTALRTHQKEKFRGFAQCGSECGSWVRDCRRGSAKHFL